MTIERDPAQGTAQRLICAIGSGDYRGIFAVLAPDARFRYLVPSGPGQVTGAADVAVKYLDWFGGHAEVEVQETLVERVADRISARYRFLLRENQQWKAVEQQAYLDIDADGRIAAIDLLCSGFRSTDEHGAPSSGGEHRFDAGAMGCADGLASEFRRRIGAIPVGDVLVVTAHDPAAKEDLPPLARLMGHTVHSVEAPRDGRLVITVERGR
jgi:TusA-related sulfurtransferase